MFRLTALPVGLSSPSPIALNLFTSWEVLVIQSAPKQCCAIDCSFQQHVPKGLCFSEQVSTSRAARVPKGCSVPVGGEGEHARHWLWPEPRLPEANDYASARWLTVLRTNRGLLW